LETESDAFLADWRGRGLGLVRILFGVAQAIDAAFKWSPGFFGHFTQYLSDAADGQPEHIKGWIALWAHIVHANPSLFASVVAIAETLIAIGLILGAFSTLVDIAGALLMFLIWSTAEGFGGPYKPGSTDIGAAIIYILVFAVLFFTRAGLYFGLDRILGPRLGRWRWLGS
jgi:thiosulfate dehydrogenase (quinone) large subunit